MLVHPAGLGKDGYQRFSGPSKIRAPNLLGVPRRTLPKLYGIGTCPTSYWPI